MRKLGVVLRVVSGSVSSLLRLARSTYGIQSKIVNERCDQGQINVITELESSPRLELRAVESKRTSF